MHDIYIYGYIYIYLCSGQPIHLVGPNCTQASTKVTASKVLLRIFADMDSFWMGSVFDGPESEGRVQANKALGGRQSSHESTIEDSVQHQFQHQAMNARSPNRARLSITPQKPSSVFFVSWPSRLD